MAQDFPDKTPEIFPDELRSALDKLSRERAVDISRFSIAFEPFAAIGQTDTTYLVFVHCNDTNADARELVRLLQSLEDEIKDISGLSVAFEFAPPDRSVA